MIVPDFVVDRPGGYIVAVAMRAMMVESCRLAHKLSMRRAVRVIARTGIHLNAARVAVMGTYAAAISAGTMAVAGTYAAVIPGRWRTFDYRRTVAATNCSGTAAARMTVSIISGATHAAAISAGTMIAVAI